MDEFVGFLLAATFVIGLIGMLVAAVVALILLVLAMVWCVLVVAAWGLVAVTDLVFSAQLAPDAPWLPWAVCGAVLGGAVGFWSIAPVYGWRRGRPLLLVVPLLLVFATAALVARLAGPTP
jgi:hypothetical protein